MTKAALTERQKMGPRFHAGIRQTWKRIFNLYNASDDGSLSPEEWTPTQKVVATEITDDIYDAWIDEAAFAAADVDNDGAVSLEEFPDSSFAMFEGVENVSAAAQAGLGLAIIAVAIGMGYSPSRC